MGWESKTERHWSCAMNWPMIEWYLLFLTNLQQVFQWPEIYHCDETLNICGGGSHFINVQEHYVREPQTSNHFIVLLTIPSFCGSPWTSSTFGRDGFALVFWCYVVHLAEIAVGFGWQFATGTLIGHAFTASHCRVFRHVEIAIVAVPLCFS